MAVVINELEHVPDPAQARAGTTSAGPSGGGGASRTEIEQQVSDALRREASRQARLWAD